MDLACSVQDNVYPTVCLYWIGCTVCLCVYGCMCVHHQINLKLSQIEECGDIGRMGGVHIFKSICKVSSVGLIDRDFDSSMPAF